MIFRYFLTTIMILTVFASIYTLGEPRKPRELKDVLGEMVWAAIMIYGFWNWL